MGGHKDEHCRFILLINNTRIVISQRALEQRDRPKRRRRKTDSKSRRGCIVIA